MIDGVPEQLERLFLTIFQPERKLILVTMRERAGHALRFLVFRMWPEPDSEATKFELVGEIFDNDRARAILADVEPMPDSGIDFSQPTEIPAAFLNKEPE